MTTESWDNPALPTFLRRPDVEWLHGAYFKDPWSVRDVYGGLLEEYGGHLVHRAVLELGWGLEGTPPERVRDTIEARCKKLWRSTPTGTRGQLIALDPAAYGKLDPSFVALFDELMTAQADGEPMPDAVKARVLYAIRDILQSGGSKAAKRRQSEQRTEDAPHASSLQEMLYSEWRQHLNEELAAVMLTDEEARLFVGTSDNENGHMSEPGQPGNRANEQEPEDVDADPEGALGDEGPTPFTAASRPRPWEEVVTPIERSSLSTSDFGSARAARARLAGQLEMAPAKLRWHYAVKIAALHSGMTEDEAEAEALKRAGWQTNARDVAKHTWLKKVAEAKGKKTN